MLPDLFSIKGKTALVTGGTRGLGYSIAEGYLRAGAVVYISSRNADTCQSAQAELSRLGPVQAIPCNVASEDGCRSLIDQIARLEPALNILVNNAGATWGAPFDSFPDAAWDKVLSLNVKAPFTLTKFARPLLEASARADDPARVINIGSIDGSIVPVASNYAYSASKAAVHHLTRHMAAELAPTVLVNAIAPGPFPSRMLDGPLSRVKDELAAVSPVKRLGRADDIAAAAIYLASPATTYMTGAVLPLDGGLSATAGLHVTGM